MRKLKKTFDEGLRALKVGLENYWNTTNRLLTAEKLEGGLHHRLGRAAYSQETNQALVDAAVASIMEAGKVHDHCQTAQRGNVG